jgi:hypothetical protein
MHGRFCEGGMIEESKAQGFKFKSDSKSVLEQPQAEAEAQD